MRLKLVIGHTAQYKKKHGDDTPKVILEAPIQNDTGQNNKRRDNGFIYRPMDFRGYCIENKYGNDIENGKLERGINRCIASHIRECRQPVVLSIPRFRHPNAVPTIRCAPIE